MGDHFVDANKKAAQRISDQEIEAVLETLVGDNRHGAEEARQWALDLRDARAALRRIAGDGDVLAGIHIIDPGDGLGACNFECEWWCERHGCIEADPAVCYGDECDEDDLRTWHIHCVEGCPTRIALEALSGTNEGEGT